MANLSKSNGNWQLSATSNSQTFTDTLYTDNKAISGDIDISITAKSGSATTPTNSTALSSTSTSLSNTTLTVQASVTPTVSAGWVSSGTAGTVKISGTVPTESKTASGSGDITPSSGKLLTKVTVPAGSAITPTNATALSSTSTSLSGTSLTVQASVTPTVSAGYVSSGTAGTVKITGTVPTETKTANAAGDILPTSGKLLTKVTVPSGAVTPSFAFEDIPGLDYTYLQSTYNLSALTDILEPVAANSDRYHVSITPKYSNTAGYINAHTDTAGTIQKYMYKEGQVSIAAGVMEITGGNISDTSSSENQPQSGNYIKVSPIVLPVFTQTGVIGIGDSNGSVDNEIVLNSRDIYIKMPDGLITAGVSGSISFTPSVSSTMTTTTAKPSGTDGTDYFSITGSGSSSGTITGSASVSTNGYVTTSNNTTGGSASGSVGSNAVKYVAKATASSTSVTPGATSQTVTISAGYTKGITITIYGATLESHTAYSGSYSVA